MLADAILKRSPARAMLPVLALAVLVPLAYGCNRRGSGGGGLPAESADSVRALGAAFAKAMNAGDAAAVAALFTDDAIVLPEDAPLLHGRAEIRRFFTFLDSASVQLTLGEPALGGHRRIATSAGSSTIVVAPKDGSATMREEGKFLLVAEQQEDGSWRITRMAWSRNAPLDSAAMSAPAPARGG